MNKADCITGRFGCVAYRRLLSLPLFLLIAAGCSPTPVGAGGATPSMQERAAMQPSAADRTALPSLRMIYDLPTPGVAAAGVTWSSDGTKLAAYSDDPGAGVPGIFYVPSNSASVITIWNADGTVFRQLRRPKPFIHIGETFAFVGGDKQIAAPAPIDTDDPLFLVFDVATGEIVKDVHRSHDINRLNYREKMVASPDQSILAVIFDGPEARPVALYSTRDWSKLPDLPGSPKSFAEQPGAVAFSRDGRFLAVCKLDGTVLIYDLNANRIVQTIDAFPDIGGSGGLAFSPDGTMIAVASNETIDIKHFPGGGFEGRPAKNPVRAFNIKDGSTIAVYSEPHPGAEALAGSPDGRFLAFVTRDGVLHVWNPFWTKASGFWSLFQPRIGESKKRVGPTLSLAFSPDGRRLAVDVGRNVEVFSITP